MSYIFLDTTLPGFEEEERRIKAEGYVEKKYTRGTSDEIERAFKIYIQKKIYPERGIQTPQQIFNFQQELNKITKETLYEKGITNAKYLKFKMYIPSDKLLKQRERAENQEMVNLINEEFAPENFGNQEQLIEKIQTLAQQSKMAVNKLSPESSSINIIKALNKTRKVKKQVKNIYNKVSTNAFFSRRAKKALNNTTNAERRVESLYDMWSRPYNELSEMMARTINTKPFKRTIGKLPINNMFVESLILTKNNNKNTNNKNTNRLSTKALVSGMLTSEIKFIRDVVRKAISLGMPKQNAILMGTVLANVPEFKDIYNEYKKTGLTNEFMYNLRNYLATKINSNR